MDHQPKINDTEAFLLISGALIIDTVPIVLVLFGLPDFFIPGIISFISQIYLRMKGINATRDLQASIAELIPYVDVLPMKTIAMFITIWADRHPESAIAQAAEKAAAKVSIKRGKGGALPAKGVASQPAEIKARVGELQPKPALTKTEFKEEAA